MNFEIPDGLTDLLQDFTVEVLRKRPDDLLAFAARYFEELLDKRPVSAKLSKLGGLSSTNGHDNEENRQEEENDEDDDEEDEDEIAEMPDIVKSRNFGNRRVSVAAEKYNPEEDEDDDPAVVYPKSDDERKFLHSAIANIFMFRSLDKAQVSRVIDAMLGREVETGDVIIEQGDDGDNFYIIETGVYDIYVNKSKVGAYENKGSFGELALMYNMPRAATIQASTNGKCWALDRLTFKRIVLKTAFEKRKQYEQLLENMPMFKSLNTYERLNVADALLTKSFGNDEAIIQQGEPGLNMYFVESGQVKVVREQDGQAKELAVLSKGAYFGELALLTKKPRAATVRASGDNVKCAILEVDAFERLLGPCVKIMQKNIPDYEEQLRKLFGEKFSLNEIENN